MSLTARTAALLRPHARAHARRRAAGCFCRAMVASAAAGDADTPAAVWADVLAATERAARAGAVYSIDTGAEVVTDAKSGVQFVVRVAKALRDKPKAAAPPADGAASSPKPPPPNPFLPYDEALFVRNMARAPRHCVLLNKFNVVPHHLLLVTRAFEHQTAPLDAGDIAALLATLRAFPGPHAGLAFMNVGDASGFSQPHKHVQLVPLPFAPDLAGVPPVPIGPLVEQAIAAAPPGRPFHVQALPFQTVGWPLAPDVTPEALAAMVAELVASAGGTGSYNLLMTTRWVLLVPRTQERGCGVAVNALGFAGTMLVRSTDELETVRADPMAILVAAGVAR